jgi:hypothetical protein
MAQRVLRFGINDGSGHRAATWKLWTETSGKKSEIYLACRSLGGSLKASLHESGAWHVAFTKEAFEREVRDAIPEKGRFIEKWPRPAETAPGMTLAFRIVTPWSAATIPLEQSGFKDVLWLPPADEPNATEIDIFIVKPTTVVSGWPGKRSMSTSLIGSIPLENGETVWAVYWVVPVPDLTKSTKGTARFFKGKTEKHLEGEGLRALVFGAEPDGSRVICDCNVQVRVKEPDADQNAHRP